MNPPTKRVRPIVFWILGTIAALTPTIWMLAFAGRADLDRSVLVAVLGPSIVSAVFWTSIARWLSRDSQRGLGVALAVGLVSPLVCLPLCVAIAPLLLPIDALTQAWGASAWMGFYGFVVLMREPLWFFPVGAAMGLLVWFVVRLASRQRAVAVVV
ncbi:MAG: hypothetical protein AB7I19_11340 [Planctomycetota bacterium]